MENIEQKREEIVSRLRANQNQQQEIRKELDAIDYEERFAEANQYVGKFFREIYKTNDEYFRCFYVYDIDKVECRTKTLEISYYANQDEFYSIEYYNHFHPKNHDEEDKYEVITEEEFKKHYNEILRRINTIMSKTY